VIALDRVAKAYPTALGRKTVLEEATVEFAPGHNFGILGANGAGKSTLIRLLAGSEMPDRGTIRRRARVSFPLGFGGTFHGDLCGRENVAFIARVYGADLRATLRFVEEFAELGEYFRYYGASPCNRECLTRPHLAPTKPFLDELSEQVIPQCDFQHYGTQLCVLRFQSKVAHLGGA